MYVKEFKDPDILAEPLEGKNKIKVDPGQEIYALLCNKTSAGFGSLNLIRGTIKYLGKVQLADDKLVIFEYVKSGVYYGYIELMKTDMFDPGPLFFLNYAGSGRLLEIDEIIYKK